jgi:uncharacterized metal-binding protein YceD (DUF177 family)
MNAPEFSSTVKLDMIGSKPTILKLSAGKEERRALARRFDLQALGRLEAELSVKKDGDAVSVQGHFRASVVQSCIASGEPVPASFKETIHIRFVPAQSLSPDAEIELTEDGCDVMDLDGQMVDLGEAVAQSLGLALNPYPRHPDAEKLLKAAGVKQSEEIGAFAELAALKERLKGS